MQGSSNSTEFTLTSELAPNSNSEGKFSGPIKIGTSVPTHLPARFGQQPIDPTSDIHHESAQQRPPLDTCVQYNTEKRGGQFRHPIDIGSKFQLLPNHSPDHGLENLPSLNP